MQVFPLKRDNKKLFHYENIRWVTLDCLPLPTGWNIAYISISGGSEKSSGICRMILLCKDWESLSDRCISYFGEMKDMHSRKGGLNFWISLTIQNTWLDFFQFTKTYFRNKLHQKNHLNLSDPKCYWKCYSQHFNLLKIIAQKTLSVKGKGGTSVMIRQLELYGQERKPCNGSLMGGYRKNLEKTKYWEMAKNRLL